MTWTDDELRALHAYAQAIVAGKLIAKIIIGLFAAVGVIAGAVYSVIYVWQGTRAGMH